MGWLSNYNNRKQITIAGTTAGAQTNYQMKARLWYNYINRYLGTTTLAWGGIGGPYQRHGFYANGRWWHFYATGSQLVFRSSTDGITWSSATNFYASVNGAYSLSVVVDSSNYVHTAYINGSGGQTIIYYRRGLCNANGTITLGAQQTVYTAAANYNVVDPNIIIDSNGYPWVSYGVYLTTDNTQGYGWVKKSSTKNGTWTQEFTQQINTTEFTGVSPAVWGAMAALTNGKVYAVAQGNGFRAEGRVYNGSTWSDVEYATTNNTGSAAISLVPEGDNVHLSYGTYYGKRIYATGWQTETNLGISGQSSITIDGSDLYVFYANSTGGNYPCYKKYSGSWGSEVKLNNDLAFSVGTQVNSYLANGKLIYYHTGGSASPYSVVWGSLIDGGGNVSLNTKSQLDFDDIRFTKADGTTPLDYWLEAKIDNGYADVWIEFDSIPASPSTINFYVYYNYPSATDGGNGEGINFGDDFNDNLINTNLWEEFENLTGVTVDEIGNEVKISGNVGCSSYASTGYRHSPDYSMDKTFTEVTIKFKIPTGAGGYNRGQFIIIGPNGYYVLILFYPSASSDPGYYVGWANPNWGQTAKTALVGNEATFYNTLKLIHNKTTDETWGYINNTLIGGASTTVELTDVLGSFSFLYQCVTNNGQPIDLRFDLFHIRGYVSPEPTWGAWGVEETLIVNSPYYYQELIRRRAA